MHNLNKNLNYFTRGWLVGNFKPSLIQTENIEVAVQEYKSGDMEQPHYHKEVVEYNIVLDGIVSFNGELYSKDEICIIEKNKIVEFIAVTDARVLVIKSSSVKGDKYIINEK